MEHFFGPSSLSYLGEYTCVHIYPRTGTWHQESDTIHNPVYSGRKDSLLCVLLFSFLNNLCEVCLLWLCPVLPYILMVASFGILHFQQCITSKSFPSSIAKGEIIKRGCQGPHIYIYPFLSTQMSPPPFQVQLFIFDPPLPLLQHGLQQLRQPSSPLSQKRFISLPTCRCVPSKLQTAFLWVHPVSLTVTKLWSCSPFPFSHQPLQGTKTETA